MKILVSFLPLTMDAINRDALDVMYSEEITQIFRSSTKVKISQFCIIRLCPCVVIIRCRFTFLAFTI